MEATAAAVFTSSVRDVASPETCSLLIVDRSVDWLPLLLHDMGYEALMFDLLGKALRLFNT